MGKRGNHEGSVFKRPNGTWGGAIQVSGVRRYFYGKTRKEVQDKLLALQQETRTGMIRPKDAPKTVEEFLRFWLSDVVTVQPKTWEHYDLCIRRVLPYIGKLKLSAVGPGELVAVWARLKEKGLANRTIKHCHDVLHNALEVAVEWRYLPYNPVTAAKSPRVERKEMRTLTSAQVRTLFEVTKHDRWHALWVMLVTTGVRLGEVTALRWSDVDLQRGRIVIQRTLQRQRVRGLVIKEPKSDHSVRSVHLTPAAVAALKEYRSWLLEQRAAAGEMWQDYDLVFPSLTGGPVDPSRVNQAFHTALHKAGLPRLRPHDLRHTAATLLLEAGIHPKVVQEMLGHSSITLTLDTYSHVTPRLHQEAASAMQGILFDPPTEDGQSPTKKRKQRITGASV